MHAPRCATFRRHQLKRGGDLLAHTLWHAELEIARRDIPQQRRVQLQELRHRAYPSGR